MPQLNYSAIVIFSIIIHLIINHGYYTSKDNTEEFKSYRLYLDCISLYFLTDAAWGFLSNSTYSTLLYCNTVVHYISMGFSVVFCCRYIITFLKLGKLMSRLLYAFGMLFCVLEISALIVNHFHPIFFSFDATGNYVSYSGRDAIIIVQLLMFFLISMMSLIVAIKSSEKVKTRNMAICLFGFSMTFALVLQALAPQLPLYSVGLTLGTLFIHIFIHHEELNAQLKKNEELNARMLVEQAEQQTQKDDMATAFGIINALCTDFHTIWIADKTDMKIKLVRAPRESAAEEALKVALKSDDCDVAMKFYVDNVVCEEDRERVARQVNVKAVLEQLEKTDTFNIDFMRRKQDGEREYIQMVFANIHSGSDRPQFVFGFRDVNDIMMREHSLRQEIIQAKDAAVAANAAKTSFLFNMSHDIRTPMNAIIGFRDLLEKDQEDPVKRADYLEKIKHASGVLLSIINNVLEMARIEKGVLQLDETACGAEQMFDMIYSIFEGMMHEKGITFTRHIDVKHDFVYCDVTKIREILINIISNAYKYTKPGGRVQLTLSELPSAREGYVTYRTTIADTGVGMSEDYLPHLYEEFSREANSTHSKIEGTGLGMPIVRRLVDFMGGTIDVQSKKGVGTTFIVTFEHRKAASPLAVRRAMAPTPASIAGKRILLAEDNDLNAEIAIAVLTEVGLTIDRSADGRECIDKLLSVPADHYDAILMDIQMPRMNGYEATRAIRALDDPARAGITIIAMTANAFEEDKREAMRIGMNAHLTKPIDIDELTKTLAIALQK